MKLELTKWQRETLQSTVGCTVGGICGQASALLFGFEPGTAEAFAAGFAFTMPFMVPSMYATSALLSKYEKQTGLKAKQLIESDERENTK